MLYGYHICAGNFTGALGVAAELSWTPAANDARSLQLIPPEVLERAATGALAYEAHHFGVWLPDFMYASFLMSVSFFCLM